MILADYYYNDSNDCNDYNDYNDDNECNHCNDYNDYNDYWNGAAHRFTVAVDLEPKIQDSAT